MPQKWVKTGQKRNTNALAEIAGWVKEKNLVEEFEFGVLSQLQMNNKEQGLVGKAWWGVSHPGTRCGRGQSSRTSGPVAGWKKVLSGKLVVGSWGGVQLDAGVDLAGIKKKTPKSGWVGIFQPINGPRGSTAQFVVWWREVLGWLYPRVGCSEA